MPTLEWIGKSKVINHHQDVPFRVLERKYSFDENGQHSEDNGSENMIIRGDNLEALKALLPRYEAILSNLISADTTRSRFRKSRGAYFLKISHFDPCVLT